MQNLHIAFFLQFFFSKNIAQRLGNNQTLTFKNETHLILGQPKLSLDEPDVDLGLALIVLINMSSLIGLFFWPETGSQ